MPIYNLNTIHFSLNVRLLWCFHLHVYIFQINTSHKQSMFPINSKLYIVCNRFTVTEKFADTFIERHCFPLGHKTSYFILFVYVSQLLSFVPSTNPKLSEFIKATKMHMTLFAMFFPIGSSQLNFENWFCMFLGYANGPSTATLHRECYHNILRLSR